VPKKTPHPGQDSTPPASEDEKESAPIAELPEDAEFPQQIETDGVPEDMASLALNPGMLGREGLEAKSLPAHNPIAETDDAAMMLRLAAGEMECFDFLINKYRRQIVHFMYRMVHNQAVAEEMAQEVFLRVYRSRETYRAEARFSTWLYRIATNLAVNHARDTKNERTAQTIHLDEPDSETGTTPDVADQHVSAETNMLRQERMDAIRQHVMALPERQRMAVLMHKYEEMDYKQIGEVLKLSESATKSLLFRAYQTLRETLKDFV
jgi:RNA polymerase sigma-70 factor, ECF subfamily